MMKTAIVILAIALLTVGGGYLYSRYDQQMTKVANNSRGWPSVTGLVTRSNLEARRKKKGRQTTTEFRVEVDYEYVVDGRQYENDVVQFNQNNVPTSEKEIIVSTHPEGKQVQVYYDPEDPGQSVLVRGSWP